MKRGTSKNPRFRLRKSRGRREEPRSGRMTATPTNRRASDSKRETFWKLTRKCFAIEKKRSSDTQEAGRHTRGGFKKRGGRDTKEAEKKRSQGDGRKIAELRVSKLKFVVQGSQERRRDEQQCDEEERRGNTRKRGNSSLLSAGCDRTAKPVFLSVSHSSSPYLSEILPWAPSGEPPPERSIGTSPQTRAANC
jgi:hypothetical protein